MNIKIFLLVLGISCYAITGELKLTGNPTWDLQLTSVDSLTTTQNSVVQIKDETKSPTLNGLYSLVIPGAGQYNTERYTKAAIFIAVEAALITYAIINNNKGDKKTTEFQNYADKHWSSVRYALWINQWSAADYLYGPSSPIDTARVARHDFSQIREWELGDHFPQGFSHQLPEYGSQQYYELIGKYDQYKFGWDTYPQQDGIPVRDYSDYHGMIPQQMKDYAAERGKANDYYYAATFAVSALIVNHVISAIDSYLSTRAYNREISATVNIRPEDAMNRQRLVSELRISVGL